MTVPRPGADSTWNLPSEISTLSFAEESGTREFEVLSVKDIAEPFPAGKNERLELDFLTPFQMKINPVKKNNLYFYTLVTYLLTRLDIFPYVFCGRKLEADLKRLVARSH